MRQGDKINLTIKVTPEQKAQFELAVAKSNVKRVERKTSSQVIREFMWDYINAEAIEDNNKCSVTE